MKKKIAFLTMLLCIIFMTGCETSDGSQDNENTENGASDVIEKISPVELTEDQVEAVGYFLSPDLDVYCLCEYDAPGGASGFEIRQTSYKNGELTGDIKLLDKSFSESYRSPDHGVIAVYGTGNNQYNIVCTTEHGRDVVDGTKISESTGDSQLIQQSVIAEQELETGQQYQLCVFAAMGPDDDIKIKGPVDEETIKKLEAVDIISITFAG